MKSHRGWLACLLFMELLSGRTKPIPTLSTLSVCPHQGRCAFVYILRLQRNISSQEGPEGVNSTWFGTQRIQNNSEPCQGPGPTSLSLAFSGIGAHLHTENLENTSLLQHRTLNWGNGDWLYLCLFGNCELQFSHNKMRTWAAATTRTSEMVKWDNALKVLTQYLPHLMLPINYNIISGMMLEGKHTENCLLSSTQNNSPGQEVNELRSNYLWCTGKSQATAIQQLGLSLKHYF